MPEFIVVAENEADARMVCALADRVFLEESPEWLDETVLPHVREWTSLEGGSICTRWTAIHTLYQEHKLPRYRGHVDGNSQGVDTAITRKVIRLALKLQQHRDILALVLSRDLDSQHERKDGMQQAVAEVAGKLIVAVASQYPKREAWILNGFFADSDQDNQRLEAIRQRLNFDPCEEAHRLRYSSSTSDPARNPKRIIDEHRCWAKVELDILRTRGENTYLRHYLDEVKEKLLPRLLR
jgi:hypothetical protein